ncbi:WhiB family transcriptional regulator [Streptomyces sp. NPDC008313]|uniref:WhiB family transcriptional regulator n=1 Tax=Streptomyces sp. NPDC008313 TaxID=3364826 RepID=UPI0036ED840C
MHAPAHHHADTDPWVERAACRDADPEIFFPPAGGTDDNDRESSAKRLCARCPVAEHCLHEALLHEESTGIWGGLNVRERRELLRVAGTLDAVGPELATSLAEGARHISAPVRERPAYVWFLHRQGWSPGRIAGVLGLTFGQVQQAWHTARSASGCAYACARPVHVARAAGHGAAGTSRADAGTDTRTGTGTGAGDGPGTGGAPPAGAAAPFAAGLGRDLDRDPVS